MKAQKFVLLAIIALLLLTSMSAVVRAQDAGSEADSSASTGSTSEDAE